MRGSIESKVLIYGSIVLAIIATVVIIAGIILLKQADGDPQKIVQATSIITGTFYALLPVIATWVGTVIAFYFGKANFEAAGNLVKQITNSDQKLQAIKVSDPGVMILFNDISFNKDIVSKEDKDINVQKDLIDFMDTNKKGERLPIFNDKKVLRYIIHESTVNEFVRKLISSKYDQLKDKKPEDISLEQMINNTNDDLKNKITKSASYISKTATLFEASQKLINNPLCQDVFVTETGNQNEEIIGWITNNKISELAKV